MSSQRVLADVESTSALPAINNSQNISRINAIMQIQKREQQIEESHDENRSEEHQMETSFNKSSTKKTNEMASMEM